MKRKHRVNFENFLEERVAGLRERSKRKLQQKLKDENNQKEKTFAKFYEMSYNELRRQAKEKNIKIYLLHKSNISLKLNR